MKTEGQGTSVMEAGMKGQSMGNPKCPDFTHTHARTHAQSRDAFMPYRDSIPSSSGSPISGLGH